MQIGRHDALPICVAAAVDFPANMVLKPGGVYATPRTFVAVYKGDYYEPLSMWWNADRKTRRSPDLRCCRSRFSSKHGVEAWGSLRDSAHVCGGLQRRLLRATEHVVECRSEDTTLSRSALLQK